MAKLTSQLIITGVDFVCAIIQKFMDSATFKDSAPEEYQKGFYDFGNAILAALKNMQDKNPAADFAEVIHAENITDLNPVDAFICSNCGFACDDVSETINDEYGNFSHYREFEFKFCPNCGAKMDGERKTE